MQRTIEFKGIGTTWYLEFFEYVDEQIVAEIKAMVHDFEALYSRFLPDSEVSRLNEQKHLSDPSADFLKMLELGEQAKKVTAGAFDVSSGGILEEMGYDAKKSFIPSKQKHYRTGELKIDKHGIRIPRDTRIDLGGIGKGFLVDKVRDFLFNQGVHYFLINAGGDIYATSDHGQEIEFGLESPFDTTKLIGMIKIKDSSIACSTTSKRRWKYKDTEYHHLVQLIKHKTSQEIKATFTYGANCTSTDLASTSLFLSDSKLYEQICRHYGVQYLLVFADGSYNKSENYPAELFKDAP